jgi:non-specific serine/threonine protein kinase
LPDRLTSFIGRQSEIAEIAELVLTKRLVTLSGPGGIGKTSLALEVALALQPRFRDGVRLVELAALQDGELVAHAIAAVLGVHERSGESILETLRASLSTSHRLLVLDNCEHLVLSCARVAEALLQASPRLTIIATSREPLRIGPKSSGASLRLAFLTPMRGTAQRSR